MHGSSAVSGTRRLTPAEVDEVLALARAAGTADGADPLAEHVLLRLRQPDAPATHLTVRTADGVLAGYAYLEPDEPGGPDGSGGSDESGGPVAGTMAELVVHPEHRRRGVGRALAERVAATPGPLRLWAHGDHPSAAALAVDLGFRRARMLWQLRRPLGPTLPETPLPAGVRLRAFRPGLDDEAWLAVNGRAFASHPEQGRWSLADLRLRLAEPWFDPAGFLLAVEESGDRLLGFHWTKLHGDGEPHGEGGPPGERGAHGEPGPHRIGEVYVLGVDPSAHRGGLGRALTVAGLAYLRDRGVARVMLYVDESNASAVALYERLGFAHWAAHVHYRRD
ncbi:mycothiol synthase [Plantactinospora sp. WMMB334]|uniref:mycothiol synthase n=1 Tax=Plantactinospora sp. WMMB334 TaxID=3404119 RepID=UPI003B92FC25